MTMLPTFLAGINWVMHSAAGWRAGWSRATKFVLDCQVLEMLQHEFTPLEIDEASLAFGAHDEVRHGGHFLGAAHDGTVPHLLLPAVREQLGQLRPLDAQRCEGRRRPRPRRRAQEARRVRAPPLDDAVREELAEYVTRRRREPTRRPLEENSPAANVPATARVVVIGAGIVGNSLVHHLAQLGWRDIVQIDKGPLPNPAAPPGTRRTSSSRSTTPASWPTSPSTRCASTRSWACSPSRAATRSPAPRSGWRSCAAGCRRPGRGAYRPSW